MSVGQSSSALHLQSLHVGSVSNPTRSIQNVTIHPVVLFTILDHYLRRTDDQERVIGTLLGTRTETEIEVHNCFAVLHSETSERVAVDMEYHRTMYDLHHKVHPKEVIVGWYSTGSNLNTYSALIQNFYSQETAPHTAIHVALNTGTEEGSEPGVKAFISSPVGVYPKPENCVFVPIPCELRFNNSERGGLDLLTRSLSSTSPSITNTATDLEVLERSVQSVSEMLDRVLAYVRSVIAGETKGDPTIGRYLLETFATSTEGLDQGSFATSLQDTLMISYLANLIRSQAEVSSRLQLVTS
ncbi:Mov34-domain-containing protein [Fomitiporia mediterranea MF3/22]|uniref:Mov34-domain-containing protein n=1 Tax=Fomitiporia mediterranea (strain MF3/22) TaxID=694068 RepID=UPI0004409359|nr:Mov34-domain-containing protein [Fomitiporia mediterranea MF3/22]EJD01517.1 Mov34-domain-containing protein [Fomitiporia mediterranea MF3/22]